MSLLKQFVCVFIVSNFVTAQDYRVQLEEGWVQGTAMRTRDGKSLAAYKGIPYAEAPINSLRFQDPVPKKPWSNTFNATLDGPICPQVTKQTFTQSEDCLTINVYTKEITVNDKNLKPVIFFIHGGAYITGSGIRSFSGPEYLLDRDIILVTINYRIGPLGFLSTGTKDAPGNAALKDQVLALKWVQRNIKKFGGDPNSVTIAGQSAGSFSVTLQLISPMSKGLFHKAIALSGSMASQIEIHDNNMNVVNVLAKSANCENSNKTEMIKCLQEAPLSQIIKPGMFPPLCEGSVWRPVIEKDFGQEIFLTEDPSELFRDGNFTKVPTIAGIVENEFIGLVQPIMGNQKLLDAFNTNLDAYNTIIMGICIENEKATEKSLEISQKLRDQYIIFDKLDKRSFDGFGQLAGDANIGYGVHRFVHLASNHTDKIYYYKFIYRGRFSGFNYPKNLPYGVEHSDDLFYLFYREFLAPNPIFNQTDPENLIVERMTRIWENFAKTGDPNNSTETFLEDLEWHPFSLKEENYMEIGPHFVEKNGLFLQRFKVWDDLFPIGHSGAAMNSKCIFSLSFVAIIVNYLVR